MFLLYGLYQTYLSPDFYTQNLDENTYDYVVRISTEEILMRDVQIQKFFTATDLRREIGDVFTYNVFKITVQNFSEQLKLLRGEQITMLTFPLKTFRDSLVTVAQNLAYKAYQRLPVCDNTSMEIFDENGIPKCKNASIAYELVVDPLTEKFELAINRVLPEEIQVDLAAKNGQKLSWLEVLKITETVKNICYILLFVFVALIAIVIRKPFALIVKYEAIAFILSGILGYVLSFGGDFFKRVLMGNGNPLIAEFGIYLVNFPVVQIQRLALIFVVLGFALAVLRLFFKRI